MENTINSKIKIILISILPLFFSLLYIYKYFNNSYEKDYSEKIKQNTELIKDGIKTKVKFNNNYTLFERKADKFYSVEFTYFANNKEYKNSINSSSEESLTKSIQNDTVITYNPKNPEIYSFNPNLELEQYKKELNNKNNYEFPWGFLAILLGAIGAIIYSIIGIKNIQREQNSYNEF